MRKGLMLLVGALVVVAAGWSAVWYWGKGKIVQEIEIQAERARDGGAEISYAGIDVAGFPFGYEGRVLEPKATFVTTLKRQANSALPADAVIKSEWSADWIEANADVGSPDTLRLTFPEKQLIRIKREDDKPDIEVDVLSENLTMLAKPDGKSTYFDGAADALSFVIDNISENAPDGVISYAFTSPKISGTFNANPPEIIAGLGVLPPGMKYSFDSTVITFDSPSTEDKSGFKIAASTSEGSGSADMVGDHYVLDGSVAGMAVSVETALFGPDPILGSIGPVANTLGLSAYDASGATEFTYKLSAETITLPDQLWMMVDPSNAMTRELTLLDMDLEGSVSEIEDTGDNAESLTSRSAMPVNLNALKINKFNIEALGLEVDLTGEGAYVDNTPTGGVALKVGGFPGFIETLVKAGRIPPQQAMIAQLMVENFGRMEEDGETIRFDIESKDGLVFVNGAPVGAAPGAQ